MDFVVKCFVVLDFMVAVDLLLPAGESALTTMVDNQFLCLIANLSVWLTPLGTLPTFTPSFPLWLSSSVQLQLAGAKAQNIWRSLKLCTEQSHNALN